MKVVIAAGLFAPILTFAIALAAVSVAVKTAALLAVAMVYLGVCIWAYRNLGTDESSITGDDPPSDLEHDGAELHSRLIALEEAREFFGSSLRSEDMFRLVSSRVRELFPFRVSTLFVPDETGSRLTSVLANGDDAEPFALIESDVSKGIAGMAYLSGETEFDQDMKLERASRPDLDLSPFQSSVAIPLIHDGAVFAVFQLYREEPVTANQYTNDLLGAIGERIGPLFLSAQAFDRSLSSALVDPLTELPNERAFFLVLENQLAESQRLRDERPLTVIAIDIKGFEEANRRYGHSTGDRLLKFVGATLRAQLRKMDFLARSVNDEFLVILPTAASDVGEEIIERIKAGFETDKFDVGEHESMKPWLNFGSATFWKDGETGQQLLRHAQLRKQQAKSADTSKVLWFPKEYVN
ncbi:MAG: GGDEF domain-containing protein [Blastocatellia bacterium]|nr:GGDEF domain-containing protein [Blastocatellia bacterium]